MIKLVSDEKDIRIDKYLANILDYSREYIGKLIDSKLVLVNEKVVKASYKVSLNDEIVIHDEEMKIETNILPVKMDLDIVYEDDDVIVVNKETGVVVHPGVGNTHGTLVNGLLYHSKLSDVNGEFRPGIVHRIDADTTGLLMVAKNNKAHEILAKQLEEKTTTRIYYALVWGVIKNDTGTIDAPIGRDPNDRKKQAVTSFNSKDSITHFRVLERYKNATLIELKLETGRTHQIRVHMDYIGYPVVNDPVYGRRKKFDETGQCLHAKVLGFHHPTTGKYMEFDSELPECFTKIQEQLKNED